MPPPNAADHLPDREDNLQGAMPTNTNDLPNNAGLSSPIMPGDTDNDADADATEYSLLMSYPQETDYYALLGLPRDPPPTDAAIRSAYRTLTLSFHPDKQPPESREAAERVFARIREAYETLTDPRKRVVYDLLGAEGVREEWGVGGVMGKGGEGERERDRDGYGGEVGVRALRPEEFRRWFLQMMKRRERGVVNSMVRGRGSFTLGINASDFISVDKEAGEVYVGIPSPKLSTFALGYASKVPFPTWRVIFGVDEKEDEDEEGEGQKGLVEEEEATEMTIHAGISGPFQRLFQEFEVTDEDGKTEKHKVPLPLILSTPNVSLGANVERVFGDFSNAKGILRRWPFSFLQNSAASVSASILPAPALNTSLVKAFAPIQGTKPFRVVFTTGFKYSIFQALPTLGLQVTKQIGERKHAFCTWSSGVITWPVVVQELLRPFVSLGLDFENAVRAANETSQFQFGILSQPRVPERTSSMEDDEEDLEVEGEEESEYARMRAKKRDEDKAREAWQVGISSSPLANGISFTYSRNIFSGGSADEVALSEWSSEKHYPLPPTSEPRSVRLIVTSTVDANLSLAWNIEGQRRVGEFTRVGLGVGVQGASGLVMTVSWSRLGQRIKLPIAICPLQAVNADAAAIGVLLPWLTYCAVEFGFIRPRDRRNRRKVIARRQKQLRKLIPQKRAESEQAIELMADQVRRRQAREENQGGLVILKAEYGHYPSSKRKDDKGPKDSEVADVTIPVAALVDRGQLLISKKTVKFHILGFHDPAPLQRKTLKIWYRYHGKEHYVEADDGEGVTCPMRTHLLDG